MPVLLPALLGVGALQGGGLSMSTALYDLPVSNHGARVRLILYKKGIEAAVPIVSPMELGGLRSAEYLALNPQGKMPMLVDEGLNIFETDAICRHVLDKFSDSGPSFMPSSLAARTRSEILCRVHDAYIGPIQGCMYKPEPPFGRFVTRAEALVELRTQLQVVEELADAEGPYLTGSEFSLADATLFPTMVFVTQMLPKFDEQLVAPIDAPPTAPRDAAAGALGVKLLAWWTHCTTKDEECMRVLDEIMGGLEAWESRGRWDTIYGAGDRDLAPATLFDKILSGDIPADVVYEDDSALAFRDIAPVAPTHILVIPKVRQGLTRLGVAGSEQRAVLGHLMQVAAAVAKQEGLDDFRVVCNSGEGACQSVFHLHLHVLGGRPLKWPPG